MALTALALPSLEKFNGPQTAWGHRTMNAAIPNILRIEHLDGQHMSDWFYTPWSISNQACARLLEPRTRFAGNSSSWRHGNAAPHQPLLEHCPSIN